MLIWQKNVRGFLDNLFEYYFLNTIVNVNFFSDLRFEYFCEYYSEIKFTSLKVYTTLKALNIKLNLMGGAMKYFRTK